MMQRILLVLLCTFLLSCSRNDDSIIEVVKEKEVIVEKTVNLFEKMETYCKSIPDFAFGRSENVAKIMSERVISVLNSSDFDMVAMYVGEWDAIKRDDFIKTGNELHKPIVFMKNYKIKEIRFYGYADGYNEITHRRLTGDDIKPIDSFFKNHFIGIASREDILKMSIK
ncbi:hypothetical protein PG291_01840 [Riemerella anatipestifer]|nr:hypothetical protein [Riemerella anatipestifer]